jgi:hypothetical protein
VTESTRPPWPSRVEAVEIAKLDLKPGDTLIVKAKDDAPFGPEVSQELQEFFEYWYPYLRIVVIGMPVRLEVVRTAPDRPADPER